MMRTCEGPEVKSATPKFSTSVLAAKFIQVWSFPCLSAPLVRVGLVLLILILCLVRAFIGLWAFRVYAPDAFTPLDGAWRVLHAQRPHIDFYSALGPVTYLLTAAGLLISNGAADGLAYAQALFGAFIGIATYWIARGRLHHTPTALVCLVVVLICITPSVVGDPARALTPGTTYNRYGYALLSILLIEAVRAPRTPRSRTEFWGGVLTGAALGLMLFLKVSFFLGGAFMMFALVPMRRQDRARWYGAMAGFGVVCAVFLWYLKFGVFAILRDLSIAAHAKHMALGTYLLYDIVVFALPFLIAVKTLTAVSDSPSKRRAVLLAALSVCCTGFFLLVTSWQFFALPLDAVLAILLIDWMVNEWSSLGGARYPRCSALLLLIFLIFSNANTDAMALGFALWGRVSAHSQSLAHFSPAVLSGFTTIQHDYADFLNDGFDLLTRYRQPSDTVVTLDFTDPFSFALAMKPATGGATWLQYRNNFDESGPSAERLFGNVKLVMVPKRFTDPTLPDSIPRIYGPYLAQHFQLESESGAWRLYRRTAVQAASR